MKDEKDEKISKKGKKQLKKVAIERIKQMPDNLRLSIG